ncbi:SusD/RagB family nutrient-binding outer membrane lipoprotein [Sphingobacterium sp. UDSM-2020]|uniref:SusD/RagB family nutrient-binding outer membrane lipoprotein n=1 Tax=Sphingobacterium sp. UDSM-2020 TaxID=2795738 RepID=UPI001937AB2B|nr:SusD/RagB family nutrient-binding outer membrane lipoprotein [Sphingobacterium sp. UDSM-2020]QQD14630.1 SusD/RagB family nutrient-binding outer membrane lipoprotein [Sphingobacterium sp. UDSM-2020]
MKKILITIFTVATIFSSLIGCKKQLEEKFQNPDATEKASISAFFAELLNNDRVRPSYWHYRTFILSNQAIYTQTASFTPSNSMYQPSDSYSYQYWTDFYAPGVLGIYRSMEKAYTALPETEQPNSKIILQAAKVVMYDEASKLIDNFGDIPFSEAGSLPFTNEIKLPKFDEQKELYYQFIADLKEINTYFESAKSTPEFSKYDILNKGNITKWRKYTNSLRLRLLMRISNVDEAKARTEILEMLNNPAQYPLADGDNDANYKPDQADILLAPLTNNTSTLRQALIEGPNHYATDHMLNKVMLPSQDPRIPVFYDKFGKTVDGKFIANKEYRAMPITFTSIEVEQNFPLYSVLDSTTFADNKRLPGIVFSASETNFIKAEAQLRWGSAALAKEAYNTAVKQSISFYYYLNSINDVELKKETKPSENIITNFVDKSSISFTGNSNKDLELILTQKWLHYGFLQAQQAWAELRRTGYPVLTFPVAGLVNFANPPMRLNYPSEETANNSENYEAVKAKDKRDTKIFWDVN